MPLIYDIQQAINHAIASPDYSPPLPKLAVDVWNRVLDWKTNQRHNDCLEWLGDGLMYAAISVELYRQVPKGTPDMFTKIRGPIVSNQTFALLTNKLNLSASLIHTGPSPQSLTAKCFADLFEVLPAEVYMREGFDVLRDWVANVFGSLIAAGVSAYERFYERRPGLINKRRWDDELDPATRLWNKREKTSSLNPNRVWFRPVDAPVSNETPGTLSGGILRDSSTLPSNSAASRQSTNDVPLPARDLSSSHKAIEKPHNALSEISRNTASLSQNATRSIHTHPPRPAKRSVSSGSQAPVGVHLPSWKQVPTQTPDSVPSGLGKAVLASPSRYASAAPSAPACGPGSSRFDPIVIDDEDEPRDDENETSGPSREVIELLDDDDVEQVENILVPVVSALAELDGRNLSEKTASIP